MHISKQREFNLKKGLEFFEDKNYLEAISSFKRSLKLKKSWEAYKYLGLTLFKTNQYEEAATAFNESLELHKSREVWHELGVTLYFLKRYENSIKAFKNSLELEEQWDSLQGLAYVSLTTKEYQKAIDYFEKSLSLNENFESYKGISIAYFCSKKFRQALDAAYAWNFLQHIPTGKSQTHFESILNAHDLKIAFKDLYLLFLKDPARSNKSLIDYSLSCLQVSRIDTLLLRQASLMIKKRSRKLASMTADKVVQHIDAAISEQLQSKSLTKRRYVFGVSHSQLHQASPNTVVVPCGAGTMFSIGNVKSRTGHYQKISNFVDSLVPGECCLIFEFGEVDIRNHIFKISRQLNLNPYTIADKSISNYINFVKSYKDKGFEVVISAPHCGGGEKPLRSSAVERNDLCAYVNYKLSELCVNLGLKFCTLFDKAVDQEKLIQIKDLYYDLHHLHLPPNEIGSLLNKLIHNRITESFHRGARIFDLVDTDFIRADFRVLCSNIPGWLAGQDFSPGCDINQDENALMKGRYFAIFESPFNFMPKKITLRFTRPLSSISTSVHAIFENWNLAKDIDANNIIGSNLPQEFKFSQSSCVRHLFDMNEAPAGMMCKFFAVQIIVDADSQNSLKSISVNRFRYSELSMD